MALPSRSWLLGLILLSAGAAPVLAQIAKRPSAQADSAAAAFRRGYEAFQRKDLVTAKSALAAAVRLAPKVAAGHSALGVVLLAMAEPVRAVQELELARRLDPDDRLNLLHLAVAYSTVRQYEKSVSAYHLFQQRKPPAGAAAEVEALSADEALAVGTALAATGDLGGAHEVFAQTLGSSPEAAPLHDALGAVEAQQGQNAQAEQEFRQAIALEEPLAAAHFHLGALLLQTAQGKAAIPELSRATSLQPRNVAYAVQLAKALATEGEEAKAIELLQALLTMSPALAGADRVDVKYGLALALQSGDRAKEALPLFAEVLSARPGDVEALTNAGLAHVQVGDAQGAIPLYLRAAALKPGDAVVHEDLGVAYLQQNDLGHALEQFRAGLRIDDANPQMHYDLALALKLKDDLAAAIPEFERAQTLDPALPDPPYTLGVIYMQQGRFADAASNLERALALRPENGDGWATLGSVYRELQQPDKAKVALQKAIDLSPGQPSPHITLAALLAAEGKRDEAAAQRKIGADLTRVAINRQKADFSLRSGTALIRQGKSVEATAQFEAAVAADPGYGAAHLALADALERRGRKVEAAEQRRLAAASQSTPEPKR